MNKGYLQQLLHELISADTDRKQLDCIRLAVAALLEEVDALNKHVSRLNGE